MLRASNGSTPHEDLPVNETHDKLEKAREELAATLARLRTERDELRLKMHLARAEVRDEWEKVESKWAHLEYKAPAVASAAGAATRDVASAAKLLGEEIRHAYQRIRDALDR